MKSVIERCALAIFGISVLVGCSLVGDDNQYAVRHNNGELAVCVDASEDNAGALKPPRIEKLTLAGVPALVRVPGQVLLPPVVLWHGFGPPGDKQALMRALPLDDVPALKVYLDLPLFGERLPKGGLAELADRQKSDYGLEVFTPVVIGAAGELSSVIAALEEKFGTKWDKEISLFGFSAGGAAVFLTLAENEVRVRDAIVLNAPNGLRGGVSAFESVTSENYAWSTAAKSIAGRTDAVLRAKEIVGGPYTPSLLLIHGKEDEMIPFESSVQIHEALKIHYAGKPASLRLELVEGLSHHWDDESDVRMKSVQTKVSAWLRC